VARGFSTGMAAKFQGRGSLTVANIVHLNFVFAIEGWEKSAKGVTLTIGLGSQSQTVSRVISQVTFNNVAQTEPPLSVTLNGAVFANNAPISVAAPGVLPLKITWSRVGAGAITIPVLPVSIVYAPCT